LTIPVKLPKEVLNLFPTWEYRCPDCSTYVESNISFCPNCKTVFNEKRWRVPPRFLKSHKTMSEYAHKVLAPKLTQKQRELLFKYFTELFSDGFESGDFSAWTGYGDGTSIVGSPVHHGSYSAECVASQWDWTGVSKDLTTGQQTLYVRHYRRYPTLPTGLGRIIRFIDKTPYTISVELLLSNTTLRLRDVVNSNNYDYSWSPSADTWYCLEVKVVCNTAVAGELRLWLDGSEVITQTGLDLSGTAEIDRIVIGQRAEQPSSVTSYIDCVVVADTYIGQEGTEQTYTKTWATDALFKKLGITETFSVDAALQKQDIPKTFGVDVYFGPVEAETYAKSFGVSVIFAYRVRLPELWLDENGKLVLNISKPYTWVGT
jgi:hypothetical protein